MTVIVIARPASDIDDSIRWDLASAVADESELRLGRRPVITDDGSTLTLTWTPDLTAGQEQRARAVLRLAGLMRVTPEEWAAIEADIDGLRTYVGVASPTLAQTAIATKAIVRILRALIRD